MLWTVNYKPFSSNETTQAELTLQIDHGTLYASDNYGMVAFNSATGHQKWRSSYRYPVSGSPIFQEGVIAIPYLSSGAYTTGGLEAYSIRTGRFLWQALGINYDKTIVHRKGYLTCYLAPFMVQELPPNAKCYVNILTGNKTYPK